MMRRISDFNTLQNYIKKYDLETLLGKEIMQLAQLHYYPREEMVLKAETRLEYYYLLVEGKLRVTYLFENGKSMLLKFYKEFNTLGDMELLKDLPVLCNIDAVEDTYLIALPADILRREYQNHTLFLRHLANSLSEKLYATINNSSYNYVYPLVNRLASFLLEHRGSGNHIVLTSSFLQIAEFLGTTYRHLNRTLKELEAEGVLSRSKNIISILNADRLQELAKNPYIKPLK